MNKKLYKLIIILQFAGLVFLAGCGKSGSANDQIKKQVQRAIKVSVTKAVVADAQYSISTTGSIEPLEEILVPAQVAGVIESVSFQEGDIVAEDTTLATVDILRYEIITKKAKAQYEKAKAQAKLVRTLYKNRKKLYDDGKTQKKDFITKEQLATYHSDMLKSRAEEIQFLADYELACKNLKDAVITPRATGIIEKKLISKGQFVQAGTVVAVIIDRSKLHLKFSLSELEATRVRLNQELTFTARSFPNTVFTGKIFHIGQKADPITRTVECKAVIDNGQELRPGYFVEIKIVTGNITSVILPERAVVSQSRGFQVFVVDGDRVKTRAVKVGMRTGSGIEIVDGLNVGEEVVTDGAQSLHEGSRIEVVNGGN